MAKAAKAKAITKSAIFSELAEKTELSRKQIAAVFESLTELIHREVSKKGPGIFTVPGLLKIKRVHKDATKERQGFNPATKEPIIIKAKPARTIVKAYPLKSLKEMVK
ncbi:DNA-binding protein [Planctomycetaceae bacterium SCGC AG-212-D15]|nr:DNA-binding protein [Planctomycetaceae bacterium SCGC AG-212-D15]